MAVQKRFLRLAVALSIVWVFACAAFLSFRFGHLDAGSGPHSYATTAPECLASCEVSNPGFPFRKYEDRTSSAIYAVTGAKFFYKPTVIYVDVVGIVSLLAYPVLGIFLLGFLYSWVFPGKGEGAE